LKTSKFNWRINNQIRAPKVRVIGADGKQQGILAIEKALSEANKAGVDLVEIAPTANPPVVKIIEFGKFLYEEEKKARKQKKGEKGGEVKEVRLSPFIGDHDFSTRLERVQEFLQDRNKVRLVVVFKGRQMGSKDFGYNVLKKALGHFGESVAIDMEPKFIGRHLVMVISPTNKLKVSEGKKEQKNA